MIGKMLCSKLNKNHKIVKFDLKLGHDILRRSQLEKAIKGCTGVIHHAAMSRVVDAHKHPLESVKNNILGTANVLECIRTINPKIWCIYASSREVYGESRKKIKESRALNPINVYAVTKLSGEWLMKTYEKNYGIVCYRVRFSNVYGGINDIIDRVTPRFIIQALHGKDLTVNGGTQTFDFTHVDDVTDGIVKLVNKITIGKANSKVYHFVTGRGTNLMELANTIIKITNSKSKIAKMPSRFYDVEHFIGDPSLTRKELNWEAKISLEKGLKKYLSLFDTHKKMPPPPYFRQARFSKK